MKLCFPRKLQIAIAAVVVFTIGAILLAELTPWQKAVIDGEKLLTIRGLPMNDRRVRLVFKGMGIMESRWNDRIKAIGDIRYRCSRPPIELHAKVDNRARWFEEKRFIKLIRIGAQDRRLSPSEVDPYYPFGITSSMTPQEIVERCSRPYAPGNWLGPSGDDGSITFFEDPISPVPITVWFKEGKVCGVDIETWGPMSP